MGLLQLEAILIMRTPPDKDSKHAKDMELDTENLLQLSPEALRELATVTIPNNEAQSNDEDWE